MRAVVVVAQPRVQRKVRRQPDIIVHESADQVGAGVPVGCAEENIRAAGLHIAGEQRRHVGERLRGRGVGVVDDIELRVVQIETRRHRVPPLHPTQIRRGLQTVLVEPRVGEIAAWPDAQAFLK